MDTSIRIGGVAVEFRPMSPEEMQRTMQFLLSQQAKHDARIELIQEKLVLIEEKLVSIEEKLVQIEESIVRVTDALASLTGIVGHVVGHLDRLAEGTVQLTDRIAQLAEAQQRTDDRLNVLIQMFERHLQEGHGPPLS